MSILYIPMKWSIVAEKRNTPDCTLIARISLYFVIYHLENILLLLLLLYCTLFWKYIFPVMEFTINNNKNKNHRAKLLSTRFYTKFISQDMLLCWYFTGNTWYLILSYIQYPTICFSIPPPAPAPAPTLGKIHTYFFLFIDDLP